MRKVMRWLDRRPWANALILMAITYGTWILAAHFAHRQVKWHDPIPLAAGFGICWALAAKARADREDRRVISEVR